MFEDPISILKQKTLEPSVRLDALLTIVAQFESGHVIPLAEILTDPDESPDIRSAIALTLGKISGEDAFNALAAASEEPNATVRNYVMAALGMTDAEAAIPILIRALKDEDNTVFATASQALGELGHKAVPYLIDLLSDGAEDARCIAAWQLGESGSTDAVPALAQTLRSEKNINVLALCIWALGEIGEYSNEVMALLTAAKAEAEPDVRLRAETALKKIARHSN